MAAPVFVAGDIPTADQVNKWMVNSGGFVYKTANQSITSSASVVNDSHLSVAVEASTSYIFELFMNTTSASSVGDLAWRVNGPTGAVLYATTIGGDQTASSLTGPHQIQPVALATLYSSTARYTPTWVRGVLVVAATPGTIQLQWAQQTSDATATTMQVGSYLNLVRVA